MKEIKLLKRELCFLKDMGFKAKAYNQNSESEVYFVKNNFRILFIFDTCSLNVDVIISINGKEDNIFESEVFEETKRNTLKMEVENTKKLYDLKALILTYCDFIKNNLADIEAYC